MKNAEKHCVLVTWLTSLEAGRGRNRETMENSLQLQWNSGRSKMADRNALLLLSIVGCVFVWRSPLKIAIGLNMTHNASFCAESMNAAAWNRARLIEAKLSCFCWCIMHSWNQPDWKVSKETMGREYGSLAKQVFGSVLFDWDRKGAIYTARTTNFIFWIQLEKHPLCQTYEDKHWQSNCQDIQWGSSFP